MLNCRPLRLRAFLLSRLLTPVLMALEQHHQQSQGLIARCAVITLSDTRTAETDTSGKKIRELLLADGHHVIDAHLIRDDPAQLTALLGALLNRPDIDVILTNG